MTAESEQSKWVEEIRDRDVLLGLIVRRGFCEPGIRFFTPNHFSQQLAYMKHPAGKEIVPHMHNPVRREVHYTQEVLLIKSGKLRVDFYDQGQTYLQSRILEEGDLILLIEGGHGFEVLTDLEMIEVKQGPYVGDRDKTRFSAVAPGQVRVTDRTRD